MSDWEQWADVLDHKAQLVRLAEYRAAAAELWNGTSVEKRRKLLARALVKRKTSRVPSSTLDRLSKCSWEQLPRTWNRRELHAHLILMTMPGDKGEDTHEWPTWEKT